MNIDLKITEETSRDELIDMIISLHYLVNNQANALKQVSSHIHFAEKEAERVKTQLENMGSKAP
jgi:hypothetical protein